MAVWPGKNKLNHYYSVNGGTSKIYKFFFTCLLVFCPIKEHTSELAGIDLIIWRCLAPLCLQLNLLEGRGMLMRAPLNKGLHETIFILSYSAVSTNEPHYWYLSAKASGIITLIYI